MSDVLNPAEPLQSTSLEAASPFDLRVNLSAGVSESAIKNALDTGDMGFLYSNPLTLSRLRALPVRWETSRESTCCPFISWAGTNGRKSA